MKTMEKQGIWSSPRFQELGVHLDMQSSEIWNFKGLVGKPRHEILVLKRKNPGLGRVVQPLLLGVLLPHFSFPCGYLKVRAWFTVDRGIS